MEPIDQTMHRQIRRSQLMTELEQAFAQMQKCRSEHNQETKKRGSPTTKVEKTCSNKQIFLSILEEAKCHKNAVDLHENLVSKL